MSLTGFTGQPAPMAGWAVLNLTGHIQHVGWITQPDVTGLRYIEELVGGRLIQFPSNMVHSIEWLGSATEARAAAGIPEPVDLTAIPVFNSERYLREIAFLAGEAEVAEFVATEDDRHRVAVQKFREDLARHLGHTVFADAVEVVKGTAQITIGDLRIVHGSTGFGRFTLYVGDKRKGGFNDLAGLYERLCDPDQPADYDPFADDAPATFRPRPRTIHIHRDETLEAEVA